MRRREVGKTKGNRLNRSCPARRLKKQRRRVEGSEVTLRHAEKEWGKQRGEAHPFERATDSIYTILNAVQYEGRPRTTKLSVSIRGDRGQMDKQGR